MFSRKTIIILFTIMGFFICTNFSVMADEWDNREDNATQDMVNVNKLVERHRTYRDTRDNLFVQKGKGYQDRLENILQSYYEWITRWFEVMEKFEDVQHDTWDSTYLEIKEMISEQEKRIVEIEIEADRIKSIGKNILEHLDRIPPVNPDDLGNNAAIAETVDEHLEMLKNNTKELSARLDYTVRNAKKAHEITCSTILTLFRRAYSNAGLANLNAAVDEFEAVMAYQSKALPVIHELTLIENNIDRAVLFLQAYTAEDLLDEGNAKYEEALRIIENSGLRAEDKKKAIDRIQVLHSAMNQHVENLNGMGFTRSQILAEFANIQRNRAIKMCQNENPGIDCQKAKILSQIDGGAISEMSENEQKFYEEKWVELFSAIE